MRYSRSDYANAYKESVKKDGIINIYLIRPISIVFTRLFSMLNITPNYVTWLSFLFSTLAFMSFISLLVYSKYIGLFFLFIALITDCSDGQLAILTNNKTELGAFLDPFLDRVSGLMILSGLSYMYYAEMHSSVVLFLLILFLILHCLNSYLEMISSTLRLSSSSGRVQSFRNELSDNISRLVHLDGGSYFLLTFIAVVSNQILALILVHSLIKILYIALAIKGILRKCLRIEP